MQILFPSPFFKFQLFNFASPSNIELKDDPRLINSPYQTKYLQNYESLKYEYKSKLSQAISFVALGNYLTFPTVTRR